MRKIIVLEHLSIDGVIQGPGGREEDTSGGFAYGGWSAPYMNDTLGAILKKMLDGPLDLLLGRLSIFGKDTGRSIRNFGRA